MLVKVSILSLEVGAFYVLINKIELSLVVHACNSSTWETKAGRIQVGGQSGLYSKFKASRGYTYSEILPQKKKIKRLEVWLRW
jgi:hypothetical protein